MPRYIPVWPVWLLVGGVLACGPRVGASEDGGEEGTSTESTETTSATSSTGDPDTETGEESSSSESSTEFIPMPDGGADVECDPWNDDCPEGEKCNWYAKSGSAWDAAGCFEILGDGMLGDPCHGFGDNPGVSGLDDCAKGFFCTNIDADTGVGYCVEHCHGDVDDPQCDQGDCTVYGSGIGWCMLTCHPLEDPIDCPNPENLCVYANGDFVCIPDASGGLGSYGTACKYVNECNQGLFCADKDAVPGCMGAQGCCTEFCDLSLPDPCPDQNLGVECVPFYEEAPPGYEDLGACVLPG